MRTIIAMRSLVVLTTAAVAAAAAGNVNGVFELTPSLTPLEENAGSPDLFPMPLCKGFKLEEATIDEMRKAMEKGTLTSVDLVHCYMVRTFQTQQYIK